MKCKSLTIIFYFVNLQTNNHYFHRHEKESDWKDILSPKCCIPPKFKCRRWVRYKYILLHDRIWECTKNVNWTQIISMYRLWCDQKLKMFPTRFLVVSKNYKVYSLLEKWRSFVTNITNKIQRLGWPNSHKDYLLTCLIFILLKNNNRFNTAVINVTRINMKFVITCATKSYNKN